MDWPMRASSEVPWKIVWRKKDIRSFRLSSGTGGVGKQTSENTRSFSILLHSISIIAVSNLCASGSFCTFNPYLVPELWSLSVSPVFSIILDTNESTTTPGWTFYFRTSRQQIFSLLVLWSTLEGSGTSLFCCEGLSPPHRKLLGLTGQFEASTKAQPFFNLVRKKCPKKPFIVQYMRVATTLRPQTPPDPNSDTCIHYVESLLTIVSSHPTEVRSLHYETILILTIS